MQRVAIARGAEAFSFIYREHVDIFRSLGEVVFFDPTENHPLPVGTTLLYLPGGYPENVAQALQDAVFMRASIRDYASHGGRVIAECGGMMYLCRSIATDEGCYEMCGVLPYDITARKADRHLTLGYRTVVIRSQEVRGHEFHYSQFVAPPPTDIILQDGVIASYTHLYLGEVDILNLFP